MARLSKDERCPMLTAIHDIVHQIAGIKPYNKVTNPIPKIYRKKIKNTCVLGT